MTNGTRVAMTGTNLTGTIVGAGHIASFRHADPVQDRPTATAVLLVSLDKGFFSPDGSTYIQILSAHVESLTVLAS